MMDFLANPKEYAVKTLPDFKGMKCHVLSGAFHGNIVELMEEAGFEHVDTQEEASVIVFSGGADINPKLYNQKSLPLTHFHDARDEREVEAYKKALDDGKIMFGICRGAQFLHAMNGGELWQHVEGHTHGSHLIWDASANVTVMATSIHHQMLQPNDKIDIMAVCREQISHSFTDANMHLDLKALNEGKPEDEVTYEVEIEAGAYWETRCFFVQGHPEVGSPEYRSWTMHQLQDFIDELENTDCWRIAG